MANYDPKAVNKAMAERRERRAHAIAQVTQGTGDLDERLDEARRMSDLLDELLALQPPNVAVLGGLAVALWSGDHPDKRQVQANLAALREALA